LKQLKEAGVSEAVIVAMIRSGRTPRPVEPPPPEPMQTSADPNANANPYPYGYPDLPERERERQPQVIVIDHHDQQPQTAQTMYPIGISVPGYFATSPFVTSPFATRRGANQTVNTIVNTDQGLVKARVPVPAGCVKAQPVFWGFGGKLRPGSYQPPPTVLCQ
jgi:hypothetical protein